MYLSKQFIFVGYISCDKIVRDFFLLDILEQIVTSIKILYSRIKLSKSEKLYFDAERWKLLPGSVLLRDFAQQKLLHFLNATVFVLNDYCGEQSVS